MSRMVVQLIYETHSRTTDNELGIATGWLPGELSTTGRCFALELGRPIYVADSLLCVGVFLMIVYSLFLAPKVSDAERGFPVDEHASV